MKHEMIVPAVAPRVEEGNKLTARGIHSCEVGPLAEVAAVAGQCKIADIIASAVLFGDDVLNVVRQLAVILV